MRPQWGAEEITKARGTGVKAHERSGGALRFTGEQPLIEAKRLMYFDWSEKPEELRKALGDLLSNTTFTRATIAGRGAHAILS